MEYIKLSEVCDVRDGTHDSPKYVTDGYPLVTSKNIVDGKLDLSVINYLSQEDYDKINERSKVDVGDIIMPMIGTIGNPYIVEGFTDFAIKNVALVKFPDDSIINRFVWYYLKSEAFSRYVAEKNKGGTQKFLSLGDIRNLSIPFIIKNKQEEIVELLDKVSSIIELRKNELIRLDELIKARFVEMFGDPAHNEKKWAIKNLEDVTTIVTYGLTVRPEYIDEGIDLVSARELHKGYVAYEEAPKISMDDFENLSDKGKPHKNDILFSKTGSIGHCALVEEEKPFAITQNAARIGLDIKKVNPLWVLYYLRMDYIQDWCKNHAKGNAVKDFQLQDMKIIPLFDCPLDLQNCFVEFLEQVDKSKVVVKSSLDETQKLFDSLMQHYFG